MIVLTLNSGSTSIKLGAYDTAAAAAPGRRCARRCARLQSEHHSGNEIEPATLFHEFAAKVTEMGDGAAEGSQPELEKNEEDVERATPVSGRGSINRKRFND